MSNDVEFEVEQDEGWFDDDGWRSIPNRIARDGGPDGLSWEARGMLVYLASHGRKWQTRMRDLERQGNCGRERTRRILAELIDAGYVVRTQRQERPGGPLVWRYRLRTRRASPSDGFSDSRVPRQTGEPTDGKPVDIENTNSSEHQPKEHHNPSPSPLRGEDVTAGQASLDGMPDPEPVEAAPSDEYEAEPGFVEFWTTYPSSRGKRAALLAYRRARKRGATAEAILAGAQRYAAERAGAEARFTAHAATWLNGARYDDVPDTDNPSPTRTSTGRGPSQARCRPEDVRTDFSPEAMAWHNYPDLVLEHERSAERPQSPVREIADHRRIAEEHGVPFDEYVTRYNDKQARGRAGDKQAWREFSAYLDDMKAAREQTA